MFGLIRRIPSPRDSPLGACHILSLADTTLMLLITQKLRSSREDDRSHAGPFVLAQPGSLRFVTVRERSARSLALLGDMTGPKCGDGSAPQLAAASARAGWSAPQLVRHIVARSSGDALRALRWCGCLPQQRRERRAQLSLKTRAFLTCTKSPTYQRLRQVRVAR